MITKEDAALTLLTAAEVPNFFSGMLPSLWTIGHFSNQDQTETIHWIRKGEAIALVLALATGAAVSAIADSPYPFWATLVMSGLLLGAYEHALRNPTGKDKME